MPETVAVIIASYGDSAVWNPLAQRALASVANQDRAPDAVYRIHGDTLHDARNMGGSAVNTDWLCFLDCDDELEPGYLRAMMEAAGERNVKYALFFPRVRYVSQFVANKDYIPQPTTLKIKPLWRGNYMVIGTLVQRELFLEVGGFRNWEAYEDWDLWMRCVTAGAFDYLVEGAIYRATRRLQSRNHVKNPGELCKRILSDNKTYAALMGNAGWLSEVIS